MHGLTYLCLVQCNDIQRSSKFLGANWKRRRGLFPNKMKSPSTRAKVQRCNVQTLIYSMLKAVVIEL